MGDLSFEYQDAVIAANYVEKGKGNAIELTYKVPDNTTIEDIEKALKDNNIEGSSFSFATKELSITAFNEEELNDLINKLNKIEGYEYRGTTNQNSRFLDNESRRNTYKSWLNPQLYRENRKLYNACSKALAISEAAARYPEANRESERIEAAKEAAKRWDTEFQKYKQSDGIPSLYNNSQSAQDITTQIEEHNSDNAPPQIITMDDITEDPSETIADENKDKLYLLSFYS